MSNLTFFDAVIVSLICIFVVFLILSGLFIVIGSFKYFFKEEVPVVANVATGKATPVKFEEDEETKNVAMITALIMANEDNDGKTYEIVSVENKN